MKRRIVIEVFPTHAAVLVARRDGCVEGRERLLDRLEWPQPWTAARDSIIRALAESAAELGVVGATADVLYDLPDTACAVANSPAAVSFDQAEDAALLAVRNAAPGSPGDRVERAILIGQDGSDEPQRAQHLLAVSERDSDLAALAAFVREAGIAPRWMVPQIALGTRCAAGAAMSSKEQAGATVWVGPTSTTIVVHSRGRMLAARTISVGVAALVGSVCRVSPSTHAPVAASPAHAWSELWAMGIPKPDNELDPRRKLLSAMQPVLQRIGVELKQSLRFALPPELREAAVLRVLGPGACLPGMAEALAGVSGARSSGDAAGSSEKRWAAAALLARRGADVRLVPRQQLEKSRLSRARTWIAVGACLATGFTVYQHTQALRELNRAESQTAECRARLESGQRASARVLAELARRSMLVRAEHELRTKLADGVDPAAVLRLVSESVDEHVTITGVELSASAEAPTLSLRGAVRVGPGGDPSSALRALVDALERTPLVRQAKLGATQRSRDAGDERYTFTVDARLVPVPTAPVLADAEDAP